MNLPAGMHVSECSPAVCLVQSFQSIPEWDALGCKVVLEGSLLPARDSPPTCQSSSHFPTVRQWLGRGYFKAAQSSRLARRYGEILVGGGTRQDLMQLESGQKCVANGNEGGGHILVRHLTCLA